MPFREAHGVVGELVRTALANGRRLSDLSLDELAGHSELLDSSYYELFEPGRSIDSKVSAGGTGSARLAQQLDAARAALREVAESARE
jgi:argininosuccinate lyase